MRISTREVEIAGISPNINGAGINFLLAPVLVLMPVYVDRHLATGPASYGFMLAAMSVGAIAGYLLAASGFFARHRSPLLILSLFLFAGLFPLLAVVHTTAAAVLITFAAGVPLGTINISLRTLLQLGSPQELRGRVIGLAATLAGAVEPIGLAAGGLLGDLAGDDVALVFVGGGACAIVIVVIAALDREVRSYLSRPATAAGEAD